MILLPGASERAEKQLYRALRYHTLQDPQLHNTLKDLVASVKAPGKGLSTAARLYLARRKFMFGLLGKWINIREPHVILYLFNNVFFFFKLKHVLTCNLCSKEPQPSGKT